MTDLQLIPSGSIAGNAIQAKEWFFVSRMTSLGLDTVRFSIKPCDNKEQAENIKQAFLFGVTDCYICNKSELDKSFLSGLRDMAYKYRCDIQVLLYLENNLILPLEFTRNFDGGLNVTYPEDL